jgi:hypothetical protein
MDCGEGNVCGVQEDSNCFDDGKWMRDERLIRWEVIRQEEKF